jgi:hypothetical protein
MPETFYTQIEPGRFDSTTAVVGPWDARLAHGSPPAALLMHALERAYPRDDVRVGRVTYDFHGPVPASEVSVTTEVVRAGARIELLRGRLSAGGKVSMEASAWRIAAQPGRVPAVPDARRPPPLPGPQAQEMFKGVPSPFGYAAALEWRFVEGSFRSPGPAAAYARPLIPILAGETTSPLQRLLLLVDSANGISAALPLDRFLFVPVELTVSVRRHPRTEWVGMRAESTIEGDGIGLTRAELFDEEGYLGTATQTLFVAPR